MEGLESEQENVCIVQYVFVDAKMHMYTALNTRKTIYRSHLTVEHTVVGHVRK